MVEMMFRRANLDQYIQHEGAVAVPLRFFAATEPIFFLQNGVCKARRFADFADEWVMFKIIELSLDYSKDMDRYQLMKLPKPKSETDANAQW